MTPRSALITTGATVRVPHGLVADVVIAADGGLRAALAHGGGRVDHVVGDFDSADPVLVTDAIARGTAAHRHPVAKDATDLELAMALAVGLGVSSVTVASGHGDRFDHLLGEATVLSSPRWQGIAVDAWYPPAHLLVVDATRCLKLDGLSSGELVTLLPMHGTAVVSATGVAWPLEGHLLEPGTSLGISNTALGSGPVTVTVTSGRVIVILPFARREPSS